MRRAAMAVIVIACISEGAGSLPAVHASSGSLGAGRVEVLSSFVAPSSLLSSGITAPLRSLAAGTGLKVVEYRGYELSVPASWPVYQLSADPDQCVRYDMHAVYLGMPGADQDCPPGLVGRTETVSVGGTAFDRSPSAVVIQRVPLRGRGSVNGQPAIIMRSAIIMRDVRARELGVLLSAPSAPSITATYGADPGLVQQVLASVHQIVYQTATRADPEPKPMAATASAAAPGSAGLPLESAGLPLESAGLPLESAGLPRESAGLPRGTAPPVVLTTRPLPGFDTCTAPSLATMRVWRARFAATAIYIGGEEAACDYGNLTPRWITAVEAMGWSLLPTYVGLQAPCDRVSGKISRKPVNAAAQGRTDAEWAVEDAQMFGLGRGTPIYDDMEAYDANRPRCVNAVLTFLDAWTRQLSAEGYVSGVYSSADSGIIDLDTTSMINGHRLAEPRALWFALWDDMSDLNGSPYLPGDLWPRARRSKQYEGGLWVKVRKIGLDVDLDLVNSATVANGSHPPPRTRKLCFLPDRQPDGETSGPTQ